MNHSLALADAGHAKQETVMLRDCGWVTGWAGLLLVYRDNLKTTRMRHIELDHRQ
jgi:hypothetical protein